MVRIGVADTTFARVDMAKYAIEVFYREIPRVEIIRYTVPGIKDLPLAARNLIVEHGCDGVIALGWVGKTLTDKLSYVAASLGLIAVQIMYGKHVIDVTVHEDEAENDEKLKEIAIDRATKHARNLVLLITAGREALTPYAGKGLRQGYPDAGPIE